MSIFGTTNVAAKLLEVFAVLGTLRVKGNGVKGSLLALSSDSARSQMFLGMSQRGHGEGRCWQGKGGVSA